MDTERWERIKDLLEAAVELSPEERHPFLAGECGEDTALQSEVEALLEHHQRAGSFLEGIPTNGFRLSTAFNIGEPTFSPGDTPSGRFRIVRFIGRGGMGEVYEAEDLELGARVALKTIRPEISSNSWALNRFKQEIHLARRVTHPNVCRMFDIARHRGSIGSADSDFDQVFLTMELLEGESLADRLRREGRMNFADAWPIIQQTAEALQAAHQAGVIHRDFKPSNVLLIGAGNQVRAVVTDFGLARALADSSLTGASFMQSLSMTGQVLGTLAYMAPEQLEGGQVKPATDVYALGLVIYEMLTGHNAFPEHAPLAGAFLRVKEQPPSPRTYLPDLDIAREQIIMQCLRTDPSARFQSTREVASSLLATNGISSDSAQRYHNGEGLQTDRERLKPGSTSDVPRGDGVRASAAHASWKRKQKRSVVLGACVGLLAAGSLAYFVWLRSSTPSRPTQVTQISQWNKPMYDAHLSPDGHAVAFDSPVRGIAQVFLMLTSGGEPLQLTNDEGDKFVDNFSPDSNEVYYGRTLGRDEVWRMPALGGIARRVASASFVLPSPDGSSIFYAKSGDSGIFRAEKSGLNEELVYRSEGTGLFPALVFPGGTDLLAAAVAIDSPSVHIFRISLISHKAIDLGKISINHNGDITWGEQGKSILFSQTVSGLTNIWKYSLQDRSLTQITFGAGADYAPMPAPEGKGIYFVNGKSSGFLTAYNFHSKTLVDIASEDATGPVISPDGKRVTFITMRAPQGMEVWTSDIDGGNRVKIAAGEHLVAGRWAPDNFHVSFFDKGASAGANVEIVGADGNGLRQLPQMGMYIADSVWSPDQKFLYVTNWTGSKYETWKWSVDGSISEKLMDNCCIATAGDPSGKYLLGVVPFGEKTGIYQVSISERKCVALLPGVETFIVNFARDGKSFLYAVAFRGEVTIYRQPWKDGKLIGGPQVALKVPFAFPLAYHGSAYDFSSDLSTVVYRRPGGHADLYLLSQK
jgi:serine/threonine protein kinase